MLLFLLVFKSSLSKRQYDVSVVLHVLQYFTPVFAVFCNWILNNVYFLFVGFNVLLQIIDISFAAASFGSWHC